MVKRVLLGFAVLICLSVAGFGVYLALEEQRQILSYSATTTATIFEKRLERSARPISRVNGPRDSTSRAPGFSFEPIVRYRYEAHVRQFTGANTAELEAYNATEEAHGQQFRGTNIFPDRLVIGGNLGNLAAAAPLDRFEIGQQTRVYYNPDKPPSTCLIRRPSIMPYLVVLAPVVAASVFVAALGRPGQPGFKRRRARWIAAVWYLVGAAAAGHYFWLAGSEYGDGALSIFAIYSQLGLVSVIFAMPQGESVKRVRGVVGFSLIGTFIGIWLGLLIGWIAMKLFSASATAVLHCWGYSVGVSAGVFALLSLVIEWQVGGELGPNCHTE
jgi:hypothetical protein